MDPISTTTCTARELIQAFADGRFRGSVRLASKLWLQRHPDDRPTPIVTHHPEVQSLWREQIPAQGFNGNPGDQSKVQLDAQAQLRAELQGYMGDDIPVDSRTLAKAIGYHDFDPDAY